MSRSTEMSLAESKDTSESQSPASHMEKDDQTDSQGSINQYEYESQYFGFTPITLVNGMYNSVCDLYREALKEFCKTCSEKFPNVMSEEELRKARRASEVKIDNDIESFFDKFEQHMLTKILTIDEHVVLPEDQCQLEDTESDDLEDKKQEIKERIMAVKSANALLIQHMENTEALREDIDEFTEKINAIKINEMNASEMKDNLSYYSDLVLRVANYGKN